MQKKTTPHSLKCYAHDSMSNAHVSSKPGERYGRCHIWLYNCDLSLYRHHSVCSNTHAPFRNRKCDLFALAKWHLNTAARREENKHKNRANIVEHMPEGDKRKKNKNILAGWRWLLSLTSIFWCKSDTGWTYFAACQVLFSVTSSLQVLFELCNKIEHVLITVGAAVFKKSANQNDRKRLSRTTKSLIATCKRPSVPVVRLKTANIITS